ncbi:MAG: DsbA family protein [Lachnospiraceae bacterium]|nr:DsbA family protein [Lachnospiraceae bacterium]
MTAQKKTTEKDTVTITIFTDPILALSYESEPIFRKLETHFKDKLKIQYAMGMEIDNIRKYINHTESSVNDEHAVERANKAIAEKLAEEEKISNLPIDVGDFHLFTTKEGEDSTYRLNLAVKAAQIADSFKVGRYLYNLRLAILLENRPVMKVEELTNIALRSGINVQKFLEAYNEGKAEMALEKDLAMADQLGVNTLPTYIIEYQGRAIRLQTYRYNEFVLAIDQLTDGVVMPQDIVVDADEVRTILAEHPVISSVELRRALDFTTDEQVEELIEPLIKAGDAKIKEVSHGWFLVSTAAEKPVIEPIVEEEEEE